MRLILLVGAAVLASASALAQPPEQATLDAPDPERVGRAIEMLARRGDRAALASIAARIDQGLPSTLVLRAIDVLAVNPASATMIAHLAQHRRAAVRARVAHALGELHATAARSVLADLLDDPDPAVRSAAAVALGQVGSQPVAETVLLAAVRGVPEAAIVLGQQASSAQVPRILRQLSPSTVDALAPALRILLERANVARPSKIIIVQRLATVGGGTAEHLLREVAATLPAQDSLRAPINLALDAFTPPEAP